jgi:hypothetical protein
MKYLVICLLILAGVLFAGCTTTKAPVVTPAPTAIPVTTTVVTTAPQPVFTLGDSYVNKPNGYTFNTERDVITEEFRVDTTSWGIYFKVKPLNENLQSCWFTMNVTDLDTGRTETFGYGGTHSFELEQTIPMYGDGPYKISMTGNSVKVWMKAAKRMP